MAKKEGSAFVNEGHDDSSINDMKKLSKGELQQVGSAIPLAEAPIAVNQKTGHTGTGEE